MKTKGSWRLIRIFRVLLRHGLDEFVFQLRRLRPYRPLLFLFPGFWFRDRSSDRGQRLREALEELGPIFVKFGQALSTRPDLIPPDIAVELTRLQDQVPPFPGRRPVRSSNDRWVLRSASILRVLIFNPWLLLRLRRYTARR